MKILSHYLTNYLLRISSPSVPGQTPAVAEGEETVRTEPAHDARALVPMSRANEIGREDG